MISLRGSGEKYTIHQDVRTICVGVQCHEQCFTHVGEQNMKEIFNIYCNLKDHLTQNTKFHIVKHVC